MSRPPGLPWPLRPDWLDRSFGLCGATAFRKLALAIRKGAIKHVVVNLAFGCELPGVRGPRPKGVRLRGGEGMSIAQAATENVVFWADYSECRSELTRDEMGYVDDWDQASIDWALGKIGRLDQSFDGLRPAWIELRWSDVEAWADTQPTPATIAVELESDASDPPPVKSKGGRPPTHDWQRFWFEVALWAGPNGLDDESDRQRLRNHMREVTAEWELKAVSSSEVGKKLGLLFKEVDKQLHGKVDARNPIPRVPRVSRT